MNTISSSAIDSCTMPKFGASLAANYPAMIAAGIVINRTSQPNTSPAIPAANRRARLLIDETAPVKPSTHKTFGA